MIQPCWLGPGRSARSPRRARWAVHHMDDGVPTVELTPPRSGFCGVVRWRTPAQGDCERDDSGFLDLKMANGVGASHGSNNSAECISLCSRCERCRHVSFSASSQLCVWYAQCDMDDLRFWWPATPVKAGLLIDDFETFHVRHRVRQVLPDADPMADSQLRLAITTLTLGDKQSCAMTAWCAGARRMKRALTLAGIWRVELVAIYGPLSARGPMPAAPIVTDECRELRYVRVSERLKNLTAACVGVRRYHRDARGRRYMQKPTFTTMPSGLLFKWQPMGWCACSRDGRQCSMRTRVSEFASVIRMLAPIPAAQAGVRCSPTGGSGEWLIAHRTSGP